MVTNLLDDTELLPCTLEVIAVRVVITVGAGLLCFSVYLRSTSKKRSRKKTQKTNITVNVCPAYVFSVILKTKILPEISSRRVVFSVDIFARLHTLRAGLFRSPSYTRPFLGQFSCLRHFVTRHATICLAWMRANRDFEN